MGIPVYSNLDGVDSAIALFSRLHHFGHSLAAGGGASGPDRDSITRLAAALKTREVQSSRGGAILHWNNIDPDTAGNGGYNTIGQQTRTIKRANGLVRTASSAGATTLAVGAATDEVWAAGQLVNIGTGVNGEVAYVVTVSGTSPTQTLNLDRALANAHALNDPVYSVPHAYQALNPLYIMWYGLNDVMASGTGSGGTGTDRVGERAFKEAFRSGLAKILCSDFFDANHSSMSRSTGTAAAAAAGVAMGQFSRDIMANGNQITIDVPANFPGGTIYCWFISFADAGNTVSFTLDGATHSPDLDTRNAHYTGKWNCFVKAFRNVAAGPHVIVGTSANFINFTYPLGWGIEAEIPPVIVLPGFNRPYDYDVWPNWTYGNLRGTVNANHGTGVSSFTITAPLSPSDAAGTLQQGELITFDPGGVNEESLQIAADATGTTVTTTTASTKVHNTGQTYQANAHDQAILQRCINWIPDVLNEGFPSSCLHVDVDTALAKDVANFVQSNTQSLKDGAHFSDLGHAVVAQAILDKLRESPEVTESLSAHVSVPIVPLPDPVYFLGPLATAVAGNNDPSGANLFAVAFTNTEQKRDLRRATEARLQARVDVASSGSARGRAEYSLDGGSTWKTLAKKATWGETLIQTAGEFGQIDLTVGTKDTGWFQLPAEVWTINEVTLRYVHGHRNSGTTDPTYKWISLEFR